MKLITQTDVLGGRFGDGRAVRIICESGFDAIDFSMFYMKNDNDCELNNAGYEKYALSLKDIASSYGVTFEQAHAPFPSAKDNNPEYNSEMSVKLKRSIEVAGILGVKIIVVHPVFYSEDKFEKNMELYHSLEGTAKEYGVKIALENMFGRDKESKKIIPNVCSLADEFNEYVDALDPSVFTACLDLGHCGLVGGNAADMIRSMGNRIGCLHVHDNNLVDDLHTLPYTVRMDWDAILKSLADIDYRGNFTFESDYFLHGFPDELLPAASRFMCETGRYMIKRIEELRTEK